MGGQKCARSVVSRVYLSWPVVSRPLFEILEHPFNGVYCYATTVQAQVAACLHLVERFRYVEPCFAKQCGKALHFYRYVFLSFECFATLCNEACNAPRYACLVEIPTVVACLLRSLADDIEKVYCEYVVLGELAEEVMLVYGKRCAVAF